MDGMNAAIYDPLPTPRFMTWGRRRFKYEDERYFVVRMPWKRQMYCLNIDEEKPCRPMWIAIWSRPPGLGAFKFRCGWIPS